MQLLRAPAFVLLRRAASWTNVFRSILYCRKSLISETADLSTPIEFERDGFRVGLTPETKIKNNVTDYKSDIKAEMSQAEMIVAESRHGIIENQSRNRDCLNQFCIQARITCQIVKKKKCLLTALNDMEFERFFGGWLKTKQRNSQDDFTLSTDGLAVRVA